MRAVHAVFFTSASGLLVQDRPWTLACIVCELEPLNWTAGAATSPALSSASLATITMWPPGVSGTFGGEQTMGCGEKGG